MYSQSQIDPVVSFRNTQNETVRGTLVNLQKNSLVMEIYNPYSILQVSEVLNELTVRIGTKHAYVGKAVVISMVNTGLTAIVSVGLLDDWSELSNVVLLKGEIGKEASNFVDGWNERRLIRRDYQIVVNDLRAYLSEVARWVEQVDISDSLPKENGRLRADVFDELATPLMRRTQDYLRKLEYEAAQVDQEHAPAHRAFAQAALHPLIMRAPFVFRTFTKPLGYAGDYQMVNQLMDDPRQGPSTYFQIVNAVFLQAAVAIAHRNRIDILVDFLKQCADQARAAGRTFRILNVACGPAIEIQRFMQTYPDPGALSFELLDFSAETLDWTRDRLASIMESNGKPVQIDYVQDSVHNLLKRRNGALPEQAQNQAQDQNQDQAGSYDAVYCAGLFDYLSDKVCARLMTHFASRVRPGGRLFVTNVHSVNPSRFGMEHLLEWHLIYRDEAGIEALLPEQARQRKVYVDATGVNLFAEMSIH
ncbi:class I SAM-dependent methyltransferase [Janthinobacterium agaricidamnosum]|uniref:Enzyme required for production of the extracellular factor n=1 Tax=Janthinobacterium agaricidamnosum NBRC 102515 = DSM 9628 TaxID=1349767 RepID=W0V612_9BURK|nr:class I SAM-dependent methyltransferase [Janthinobacterium agaricidamnosum]CDG83321.1 enzyme required for production of the extracellular factor [Janthinobacterium agaricidamnosum NBRC 102515 = DSM 9628]